MHALRKSVKGGRVTTKIYEKAIRATSEDTYKRIVDKYGLKSKDDIRGKLKENSMTVAERAEIAADEANAYFAQTALGNKGILRHLVSDKPALKQRVLDFFRSAAKDYRDVPKLDRQAARYYKQYKKWFDEYAGNRRYKTMGDAAYANNTDTRFSLIGRTEDGRGIYRTNYPENTPKDVKQKDIVDLVQNVWSKKPIKLNLVIDGKEVPIEARFNPELTERSDLSKIAFGNRKGTASEKRITMNLSSDLYQIAEESHHVGSKTESGKDNAAHEGVTTWHYFLTDLVYVEADGTEIECYMNIDVKQNDSGHWFYSFAIEKGSRPADVLSVVTDKSATTSTISITENAEKINPFDENSSKKTSDRRSSIDLNDSEGIDNYTEEQYNNFGWARVSKAITKNELDDLYSKLQEKKNLRRFKQSARGEAIVEVNDKPHTTLGVDNVFVFVKGSATEPEIIRAVRFNAETEFEMEIIKEALYERGTCSDTYLALYQKEKIAREYRRKDSPSFIEYKEWRGNREKSRRIDQGHRIGGERRANPKSVGKDVSRSIDLYDDASAAPTIAPRTTVGDLRQTLANSSRYRMYTKKQIVALVKKFAVSDMLTEKTKANLADAIWQSFNSADRGEIKAYANDVAEFILARTARVLAQHNRNSVTLPDGGSRCFFCFLFLMIRA